MALTIRKGYKQLIAEAEAALDVWTVERALATHAAGPADVVFVDLRDPRELQREGRMPGAFHCPRGMLEFWLDPESPYARPEFQKEATFVFFCAAGWRSALAAKAAQDMGLAPVAH
ncbi:MAG: rhodanese-like domain-containing protein, partial [Novosphingobium sp.]|nr:rhodanese-like domain-containing protein [Novosphingobium sp.]